jgi:hypothetical protein
MEVRIMKARLVMMIAVATLIGSFIVGCQSTKPSKPSKPEMTEVEFPENEKTGPIFRIKDRNDVVEVIAFARSLSTTGRYKDSAQIYLDAASRFKSASGNFEIDCKMAAVREFWLAGEFEKAHKLLDMLEKEQDIYSKAEESADIRRLRQLLKESEDIRKQSAGKA